ncbi:hypothetical protein [Meiothermus cerbereus]|uniref:hypothetical protein n=1 Tax=Meiothermus cerbereus TaxID=65552 RepID=UPI000A91E869|nr:hypothetical protein [Meiothermus cerbereus]
MQRFWRILRFLGSFRGFLVLCALALLVGLGLEWANRPVVTQLRAEAHRISSSPTALSPADKAYLRRLVGEARVVGLGEGSHGSKEYPERKAVLWAHNGHVAFRERAIYPLRGSPMGWYLR